MVFAHDIILVDETKHWTNAKLEVWLITLNSIGFWLRKIKTKYMNVSLVEVEIEMKGL